MQTASTNQQLVKILSGKAELQIAKLGATSGSSGTLLPAFDPANVQHLTTTVEEPINGWKTYVHTFQAKDSNYVDALLQPFLLQASPPMVSIRFGLTVGGNQAVWRPWEDHVIIGHRVAANPDQQSGPLVTIRTVDRLWLMLAKNRSRAHHGPMSTIVANLWNEIGGNQTMIEDTILTGHTDTSGIWYQAYESTWSFLMRAIVPLARNVAGTAGYRLFVRDNVLRFHSPGYGSLQPKKLLYTFGAPGFDRLNVEDRFYELAGGAGAAGTRRAAYDPLTGKATLLQSDPKKLMKLADSRPIFNTWDYQLSHVGSNFLAAEDARNQQRFSVLSSESYNSDFSSDKCLDIRVGDVLTIVVSSNIGASSIYSGMWLVNKAIHTIERGALNSKYLVTRGEYNFVAQKNSIDPESYESSTVAPGISFTPVAQPNVAANSPVPNNNSNTINGVLVAVQSPA